jgi:hypothetical protein
MVGTKKQPNIGSGSPGSSYPDRSLAGKIGTGNTSLGASGHNFNAANFVEDPDTFNDTPAKQKSYSWNRGESGNAT